MTWQSYASKLSFWFCSEHNHTVIMFWGNVFLNGLTTMFINGKQVAKDRRACMEGVQCAGPTNCRHELKFRHLRKKRTLIRVSQCLTYWIYGLNTSYLGHNINSRLCHWSQSCLACDWQQTTAESHNCQILFVHGLMEVLTDLGFTYFNDWVFI